MRWVCGADARYVDPRSVDAIAAGITDVLEHSPTPAERDRGASRVRERFDWRRSADVILQTLTES